MVDQTPLVSVIIPVYNSMPYLTQTLSSVLAQDLPDGALEVIAVDDGSTDGSGEELDRFAALDAKLTVIHQPNSGWPGMPRNKGLALASGEFVFFMDSDDTMAPDALRVMAQMAQEDGADVVIPRMQGTGGRGVQGLFTKHPHGKITVNRAMETISPQKLFRMSLVRQHQLGFPEGKVRLEDGMFVARAYVLATRIDIFTERPLYFIATRDDGQNISAQSFDPAGYDQSVRTIAGILREGTPDAAAGDRLVLELFQRKGLRFYAPKRWLKMKPERQAAWIRLHHQFMQDLIPAGLEASASKATDASKLALIRASDLEGMRELVSAASQFEHAAVLAAATAPAGVLDLKIKVNRPVAAASRDTEKSAPARAKAASVVALAATPLQRWKLTRGATRRLEELVAGSGPQVLLELSGRKKNKITAIRGRLHSVSADRTELEYHFVIPDERLRHYRGDIVDAWTVGRSQAGRLGERVRVSVASGAPLAHQRGLRNYATIQNNFSIDLRASK